MGEGLAVGSRLGSARRQIATVVLLVLAVSVLHYGTVTTLPLLHDVYRRLYYLPVGLAAVWFGVRGGVATSALVAVLYAPHILLALAARRPRDREPVHGDRPVLRVLRAHRPLRRPGAPLPAAQRGDRGEARGVLPGAAAAGRHDPRDRGAAAPGGPPRGGGRARRDDHPRDPQPALARSGARSEILKEDFPADSPKAEFFDILLKETDRLNKVVEEYLGFARLEGGGGRGGAARPRGARPADRARWSASRPRKAGRAADDGDRRPAARPGEPGAPEAGPAEPAPERGPGDAARGRDPA